MRDGKPNKGKTPAKAASAERPTAVRRADAARMPGSSAHASLANE
ncbi:MAG: FadR family transcriptional regulator, partial [Mesorhizobium sp.]